MIDWILGLLLVGATTGSGGPHSRTSHETVHDAAPRSAASDSRAATPAPVACRMDALTPAERARHQELVMKLLSRVGDIRELEHGYRLSLDAQPATLPATAEWMSLERRCCPFFEFALEWSAKRGATLTVSGPPGAKELVAAMLAARDEGASGTR